MNEDTDYGEAINDFGWWVVGAGQGDIRTYHRGFLMVDRWKPASWQDCVDASTIVTEPIQPLHDIAAMALKLAERGYLILVQRKHAWADYQYLAIRTNKDIDLEAL